MDIQDLETGLSLIRKDFNLDKEEFDITEELSEASVLNKLNRLVGYLLERDFGKLLQVLYRIDIPEEKLKAALASNEAEPTTIISRMIYEREMQKVATRKKYSSFE